MSLNCRRDLSYRGEDGSFSFFGVPRVGLLASRAMAGAPLQAAAGQATTVKL